VHRGERNELLSSKVHSSSSGPIVRRPPRLTWRRRQRFRVHGLRHGRRRLDLGRQREPERGDECAERHRGEPRLDLRGRGAPSDRRLHRGRLTLQLAGADAAKRSAAGSRRKPRACPGPDAARRRRRGQARGRADRPPASRRRDARPGRGRRSQWGRRSQRERPTSTINSRPFVAAFSTMKSATAINRAKMGMSSPPALVG